MSVIKGGISMQQSKYAVLAIDSLSEDSEQETDWTQVKSLTGTGKSKSKGKQGAAQPTGNDGERPLSKNAKKRARKKKNQQTSVLTDGSHNESAPPSQSNLSWEQEVKMRNQAAADVDFNKDLERAILLSKSDAQEHAAMLEESRLAERLALSESLSGPPPKTSGKKGVTLSLQEFHRADNASDQKSSVSRSKVSDLFLDDPFPITPTTPDENFFDRLSESVAKEVSREDSKQHSARSQKEVSSEDLPRLAQLKDDLEKRDALIDKLRKHNDLLKKALREAKERNRSLCKILSQGEFSTKTELIEQVDQLTTVKNELTEEVKSLHMSLEQEKSKNKTLKVELAKLGGGSTKSSKNK